VAEYPSTIAEAQELAGEIASVFTNYECTECGKEILKALGPEIDASVLKLRVTAVAGGPVYKLPGWDHVSETGQHIGVRIGGVMYDNHHHGGVEKEKWVRLFVDERGQPLNVTVRPISTFFGRILNRESMQHLHQVGFRMRHSTNKAVY
jgi:hypothetical protein